VYSNERDGGVTGGSLRVRVDFHYEINDMIGTPGKAPPLEASLRLPVTIRDVALPTACLGPRTFVRGHFARYHGTIQRDDRPVEHRTVPL
jgi:hypothetical protein